MTISYPIRRKLSLSMVGVLLLWPHAAIALSPLPDNAALLYYQAGIERLRLQERDVLWRADQGCPSGRSCQTIPKPGRMSRGNRVAQHGHGYLCLRLGLTPSGKWRVGGFSTSLQSLATWLSVDARIQTADGRYREAFKTALRLRRFGRHVGDEVFRIKAETGRLPEALPDDLPGDPYSSQNFAYQITEEGFALRCRAMTFGYSQGPRQFDFKVGQNSAN